MATQEQAASSILAEIGFIKQNHTPNASQCYFFSLPIELREMVYEYAFGTNSRSFGCRNLNGLAVAATLGAPSFLDTSSMEWLGFHQPYNRGLPWWITTCKQLCAEAMEVFLRTRMFAPISSSYYYRLCDEEAKANSLILTSHKMRNVAIPQYFDVTYANPALHGYDEGLIRVAEVRREIRPDIQEFLNYLDQMQLQDLTLELRWDRSWHGKQGSKCATWLDSETEAFDFLDGTWNGRVKLLKLTIVYHFRTGDGVERFMEVAESCARRLMGKERGCSLSWGEEMERTIKFAERKMWERTLVAYREG